MQVMGNLRTALFLLSQAFFVVHGVRTRLTWINGIGHNLEHMELGAPVISQLFGGKPVSFCHNPTAMQGEDDMKGYIGDLTQAGAQKFGRITEEVNQLVAHLKQAVLEVGKDGRVVHIAHSQGALVTHLATKQLTIREMNQIEVIAFGGAAALRRTTQTPFSRCVNYYSLNDPLLFIVPSAERALRSGVLAEDEFCFLAPRVGDPISDHKLLGPTYAHALSWEGRRFQAKYHGAIVRYSRSLVQVCMLIVDFMVYRMRTLLKYIVLTLILSIDHLKGAMADSLGLGRDASKFLRLVLILWLRRLGAALATKRGVEIVDSVKVELVTSLPSSIASEAS